MNDGSPFKNDKEVGGLIGLVALVVVLVGTAAIVVWNLAKGLVRRPSAK